MNSTERADKLRYNGQHLRNCPANCKDIKLIAAEIEAAQRDKVIELCEGENSFVAKKEHEAYVRGFRSCQSRSLEAGTSLGSEIIERSQQCAWNRLDELKEVSRALGCRDLAERIRKMTP